MRMDAPVKPEHGTGWPQSTKAPRHVRHPYDERSRTMKGCPALSPQHSLFLPCAAGEVGAQRPEGAGAGHGALSPLAISPASGERDDLRPARGMKTGRG